MAERSGLQGIHRGPFRVASATSLVHPRFPARLTGGRGPVHYSQDRHIRTRAEPARAEMVADASSAQAAHFHSRGKLLARPQPPAAAASRQQPKYGLHPLGVGPRGDGLIYTPETYSEAHDTAAPLIVMLHGAGGNAAGAIKFMSDYADEAGAIILATESQKGTWDVIWNDYGTDVEQLDEALDSIFSRYTIDPDKIAVGGFSDGATYALSLGVTNGDLFKHIIAFSPGFMRPGTAAGRPRVFISHGTDDQVLPCDRCGSRLARELKADGLPVDYQEFKGPHAVPAAISQQGMQWFLGNLESATELVQQGGHKVIPT